ARCVPRPLAVAAVGRRADRVADLPLALADAAHLVAAVTEMRNLDLRQRDGDVVLALAADHFAVGDVLAQLALDLAAHDAVEAALVLFDLADHRHSPGRSHTRPVAPLGSVPGRTPPALRPAVPCLSP